MEFASQHSYLSRSKQKQLKQLQKKRLQKKVAFNEIKQQDEKMQESNFNQSCKVKNKEKRSKSAERIKDEQINQDVELLQSSSSGSDQSDQEEQKKKLVMKNQRLIKRATFKPRSSQIQDQYQEEVDSNVMCIKFNVLKELGVLATGDPVLCKECGAFFNKHSILFSKDEQNLMGDVAKQQEDSQDQEIPDEKQSCIKEEKKEEPELKLQINKKIPSELLAKLQKNQQVWLCQYCETINIVEIQKEEIPTVEGVNYVIESQIQVKQAAAGKAENQDISVVFCVDNSGSMCITKPIKGRHKLKGDHLSQLKKDLLKFGDGSSQIMDSQQKNVTYISRLQCLQGAIENQIQSMSVGAPNRKVGLVSFSNQVTITGDGSQTPKVFAGDRLSDMEYLQKQTEKIEPTYLNKEVGATKQQLLKQVQIMEENGPTALGPALVSSVMLASKGKAGSKVIVCTDGKANVGLGNLDELKTDQEFEQVQKFYQTVGIFAKDHGVEISVITIKGQDCKLEYLSSLTQLTGGQILRVDPLKLTQQFANILSQPVIATHVTANVLLHKAVEFRNEKSQSLSNSKSKLSREIGNVTQETEITFQYTLKHAQDLLKSKIMKQEIQQLDLQKLKVIPFQVQINYKTLDGKKCVRVISKLQRTSNEKEKLWEFANSNIIGKNIKHKFSQNASKGSYRIAQASCKAWMNGMRYNSSKQNKQEVKSIKKEVRGLYSQLQSAQILEDEEDEGGQMEHKRSSQTRKKLRTDQMSLKINKLK